MAAFPDVAPTPIAQLSPELPVVPSAVLGIVTIVWPYSSVNDLFAFILAEPDLRLRRPKGQVRVNLCGPSAKAIVASGLSSGDQVLIGLEGVEWEPAETNRRLSGAGLEWQLKFTNKSQLQVKDGETGETKVIQVDHSPSPEVGPEEVAQPEIPTSPVPDTRDFSPPPPPDLTLLTPAKFGPKRNLIDGEFESPAFVKRARVSYGSLFEDGFDIFDEDGGARGRGRKRSRFGRQSGAWRYTSQSPSPEPEPEKEPELSASEEDDDETTKPAEETASSDKQIADSDGTRASSPSRPQMTDGGCQTMELDLPMPPAPNATSTAGVPVTTNSHSDLLGQSHQPGDFSGWPADSAMTIPAFAGAEQFPHGPIGTESFAPDLQLGVADSDFHPPWMSQNNFLDDSHGYPEISAAAAALAQPAFGSGFNSDNASNLAAVRFGFGASDARNASPSPRPENALDLHGPPLETYSGLGGQNQQSPFSQPTTDYPPLDSDGKVVSAEVAQPPHLNPFAASQPAEATPPTQESAAIPDRSYQPQAALGGADASISAWSAANIDLRPGSRSSKEKSGSADGHTPESALVIDNSDSEGEVENGDLVSGAAGHVSAQDQDLGVVDSQGDLGGAPSEAGLEMQYPGDDEPEYEEDDIGDYDTRQYTGPDDDEDDSHDEDLRPRSLEEQFDDGEDEEEEEEEEEDDFEDEHEEDGEDEYESDVEMDNGSSNVQRPPPASSAPVVIDLLSSDDEEEAKKAPTPPISKPAMSNTRSTPTPAAPARTSPEYGPESEEDEDIEEDNPGEEEDDDEQASSDAAEEDDMSESYREGSGPDDDSDSDVSEGVPEEALVPASETVPVAPAKQATEPDETGTVEQEPPQQTTSPNIPAEVDAPVPETEDEEMKDSHTETEHNVARFPEDEDVDRRSSSPSEVDIVETSGLLEEDEAEPDQVAPASLGTETAGRPQEDIDNDDAEFPVPSDPQAPTSPERVQEDDAMVDAPTAPSSPSLTQSFTSQVVEEKHDIVVQDAPATVVAEEAGVQLPTPMDTQHMEVSTSHESVVRSTIATGDHDTFSDALAETGLDAAEAHLEEPMVRQEEKETSAVENFHLRPRTPSGEQVATTRKISTIPTSEPGLEAQLDREEVEKTVIQTSTASQPVPVPQEEDEVDGGSDASSFVSQMDSDDPLQSLLRKEHSKITDVHDQNSHLSDPGARAPDSGMESAAASSSYGDDAHAQEFQSATSSVHEHMAEESRDAESEAPDTSTEQPEFSDAMEVQEHGEDATPPAHKDQPDRPSVQQSDGFSDTSAGYTSQRSTRQRASRQKANAREDDDDDMGVDPSVRLARAAIASKRGNRRREATPEPAHSPMKTRSFHKSSSPDLGDDSVQIARASLNTPSKAVAKMHAAPRSSSPASSRVEENTNSAEDMKIKLLRYLREHLGECVELRILRQRVNQSIDVMAVAMMAPPEPRRAKGGPREYTMSFTITDPSIPKGVVEVLLYRPHKDSLPKVKMGDIVLLRDFQACSLKGKDYGLRTTEVSSWAVFDKEGEPAQIRGPPVEYGEAETTYAAYLREWFGLLDGKARERLDKANQKIVDAGKAKQ